MSWVRFDDTFAQHPKVIGLSDAAFRLHVAAICYCAQHETDGVISLSAARSLVTRAAKLVIALVGAGLWDVIDTDVYRIHDYLDYNPSREQNESKRMAKRMAGAKGAASRWHDRGNAPDPDPHIFYDDDDSRAREGWAEAYWRNFGHEATEAQVQELENAEATHPQGCIAWILSEVGAGDLKWRNMRSVRMKLGDCATLGHGPRAPKYQPKKPTLTSSDGREFQSGLADMIVPNTNLRIVEVE